MTHRANILNGNYTEIGIGIAKGTYQNAEAVFIVQMFGQPAGVSAAAPVASKSAISKPVALESPAPAVAPTREPEKSPEKAEVPANRTAGAETEIAPASHCERPGFNNRSKHGFIRQSAPGCRLRQDILIF